MKDKRLELTSSFVVKSSSEDENILIEGYANTTDKDRQNDVVLEEAWSKGGLDNYLKNPIILAYHNDEMPIGNTVDYGVNAKGLKIVAEISKAAGNVYQLIKAGILKTFSVRFRVKDADYDPESNIFVIKDLELYEISVVSVPANADSVFSVRKCLDDAEYEQLKKEYNHMPAEVKKEKETVVTDVEVKAPTTEDQTALLKQLLEDTISSKLDTQLKSFRDDVEAAVELALEDKKGKENMPTPVTVERDGAEALIKELTDRLNGQEDTLKEALDGLRNELSEKNAEIASLYKSKMQFDDPKPNKISEKDVDAAILVSKILGVPLQNTKAGKELISKSGAQHVPGVADASEWEKEFSTRIENDMRQKLVVEPLFNTISMNTYAMQIPINPEADLAEWIPTAGFRSADGSSTGTAVDHALVDTTLKAYKLASKEYIGYEEEEDAIVPIVPIIRDAVTRRMARSSDIALLRGAQGGVLTTDPILGVGSLAAATGGAADVSNPVGTKVTVATMQTLRRGLGIWGLNPGNVKYIVSSEVYYDLLEDTDFRTMDLVGDRATIITGQIGTINGSPVIVSGEFEAKAATKFGAVAVNTSNFVVGTLRNMMVERDRDIVNQKNVIVATRRMGFIPIIADAGASVLTWAV